MKKFTLILTLIVLFSLGSVFAEEANLPSFWMSAESTAIIASDEDLSQMTSWTKGAFYAAGINWSDDVSGLAISFEGR
ncbi:MAG: hypothetical protein KAH95_01825, partial [Spirochaetales bacterium]|nr:hypothetical protein [Spirochaetales bacterium]